MASGRAMMRAVLTIGLGLALTTALTGCYSIRHRNDDATAAADGKPAPKAKKAKAAREVLPPGLAGDTAHHAYTDTP